MFTTQYFRALLKTMNIFSVIVRILSRLQESPLLQYKIGSILWARICDSDVKYPCLNHCTGFQLTGTSDIPIFTVFQFSHGLPCLPIKQYISKITDHV